MIVACKLHRYGIIDKFLNTTLSWTGGFACVRWFQAPEYLFGCFLIAKIGNRNVFDTSLPSVIDIYDIDPSRVIIEPLNTGGMFVMRIEGYDTCPLSRQFECDHHR